MHWTQGSFLASDEIGCLWKEITTTPTTKSDSKKNDKKGNILYLQKFTLVPKNGLCAFLLQVVIIEWGVCSGRIRKWVESANDLKIPWELTLCPFRKMTLSGSRGLAQRR